MPPFGQVLRGFNECGRVRVQQFFAYLGREGRSFETGFDGFIQRLLEARRYTPHHTSEGSRKYPRKNRQRIRRFEDLWWALQDLNL